jgi:hypothetical protein
MGDVIPFPEQDFKSRARWILTSEEFVPELRETVYKHVCDLYDAFPPQEQFELELPERLEADEKAAICAQVEGFLVQVSEQKAKLLFTAAMMFYQNELQKLGY